MNNWAATHQSKHKQLAVRGRAKTYTLELTSLRPIQISWINPACIAASKSWKIALGGFSQTIAKVSKSNSAPTPAAKPRSCCFSLAVSSTGAAATPPHYQWYLGLQSGNVPLPAQLFASNVNRFSLYSILKIHRQRGFSLRNTNWARERTVSVLESASRQSIDSTVPMLRVQDYLLKHCPLFAVSRASKPVDALDALHYLDRLQSKIDIGFAHPAASTRLTSVAESSTANHHPRRSPGMFSKHPHKPLD